MLLTKNLSIGYLLPRQKTKTLLSNLHLTLSKGHLTALVGVNGAGKSTLLRTLAGLQKPIQGQVFLEEKPILTYSKQALAQKISLVLTDKIDTNLITVRELVSLGRYPHTNWLGKMSKEDAEQIEKAMQITQVSDWADEKLAHLSDGQQQKVWIARALAQDTPLLLLDEPTAHLDIINRLEILLLLRKIAEEQQKAVLIASHDLTELLQVAHELWLIHQQGLETGTPQKMIAEGKIEQLFIKKFAKNNVIFDRENIAFKIIV